MPGRVIAAPISLALLLVAPALLLATLALAADTSKPPTAGGETGAPPSSRPGGSRPTGSGAPPPPTGGSSGGPGFFSDIVGSPSPLVYCSPGQPCEVAVRFSNLGAAVPAGQPIPDPAWTVDGRPATPQNVERSGARGPGWPAGDSRSWTARFDLPPGDHQVRATMPRFPDEKEVGNNVATAPVTVGEPDMAVRLFRENVDWNTRYEIKAEVQNKGTVPTRALSVIAILVVNTHLSTPPTPDQCMGNPNLSGCVVERHSVDSLRPGEKKRWKIGGKQPATNSVAARAHVACRDPGPCPDKDPTNNSASRHFGP